MPTSFDVLTYLQISVAILLILVLYHALFIAVDVRRIVRRIDDITRQVEDVIMKPISMVDQILEWILGNIEATRRKTKKKTKRALRGGEVK